MELSINILNNEFEKWVHTFGNGRNNNDLRFGQYLHRKYKIQIITDEDGFYDEVPIKAYENIVLNLLK